MQMFTLISLLCAGLTHGVQHRNSPEKPVLKVLHLVQDVEDSISKAGEDDEMVFATLSNYDQQVHGSLDKEITTLNQTLSSLLSMQTTYDVDLSDAKAKVSALDASAQDSQKLATKYKDGDAKTRSKYENLQGNVHMLIDLLRKAQLSDSGTLVTPEKPDARGEPVRIYSAIRRLLGANIALRQTHRDVFDAFSVESKHVQTTGNPVVHLTKDVWQNMIGTLSEIKARLSSMESQALLQESSSHARYEQVAFSTLAKVQTQQGTIADNEQKASEISYSIQFTKEVLDIDRKFRDAVKAHMKINGEQILAIRDLRRKQIKASPAIVKVLKGLVGIYEVGAPVGSSEGLSFLQNAGETASEQGDSLRSEAETAIHNHGDTHAILMRVQQELAAQAAADEPINPREIYDTMREIKNVLSGIPAEQAKYEEAKRGCASQTLHTKEQQEGLSANLALMEKAHEHAKKAIKAAQTNVVGIERKTNALKKSSQDFSRISSEAIKSLETQSHDRKTIQMAVRKATEVIEPMSGTSSFLQVVRASGTSAVVLMKSLLQDIADQEVQEVAYRTQQTNFHTQFDNYVQEYTHLLQQRRRHYESSLGVLQLHVSELTNDLLAQQSTLATGTALTEQSKGLCESVLSFYEKHAKTREDLTKVLRSVAV